MTALAFFCTHIRYRCSIFRFGVLNATIKQDNAEKYQENCCNYFHASTNRVFLEFPATFDLVNKGIRSGMNHLRE
jgi:hypothetical protein